VLILFLIWVYVSWLILLFGAAVAFYRQHPEYILPQSGEPYLSNRMRERAALAVMSLVAQYHHEGKSPWTLVQLSHRLVIPSYALERVLSALRSGKLLAQTSDEPPAYLPARDLSGVSVADLLRTVRKAGEDRHLDPNHVVVSAPVAQALERFDRSMDTTLGSMTVASLASVDGGPAANAVVEDVPAPGAPPAGLNADLDATR